MHTVCMISLYCSHSVTTLFSWMTGHGIFHTCSHTRHKYSSCWRCGNVFIENPLPLLVVRLFLLTHWLMFKMSCSEKMTESSAYMYSFTDLDFSSNTCTLSTIATKNSNGLSRSPWKTLLVCMMYWDILIMLSILTYLLVRMFALSLWGCVLVLSLV
jgi:hypothetical protein